ncbi:MAG: alkaline phosphatase family protein, partial [Actinobacteria bacterium]|nr:alkaline phosphatase family protein [Actinomycetota bacterium]
GWLGPRPTGSIGGRIGDVVLAARDPVGFVDPALPQEATLLAMHGSLTPDEMQVPLLAGRGRARSKAG